VVVVSGRGVGDPHDLAPDPVSDVEPVGPDHDFQLQVVALQLFDAGGLGRSVRSSTASRENTAVDSRNGTSTTIRLMNR